MLHKKSKHIAKRPVTLNSAKKKALIRFQILCLFFFQSEKQLYFQISTFRGGPNHSPLIWTPAFQWDQWALEIQSDSMGTKNLTSYAWQ